MKVETRKKVGGFSYSLGSYPLEEYDQQEGYCVNLGSEMGPFEQRQEFEVAVSIERLVGLMVRLSSLLPEEVYLILETYPRNASHRRICLTDSTISRREFVQLVTTHAKLWRDEGFIAFGAFSYDPAIELFLNEHKTLLVYTPQGEIAQEMIEDFGIPYRGRFEPYYMSVEHVHSSVASMDDDGATVPLREHVEAELFSRFDFYDQTPSGSEALEVEEEDASPLAVQEAFPVMAVEEQADLVNWRCHVHGRLVVARPGSNRDFEQVFHIAAPDESDAVDWVREVMRDTNARMVRVKEIMPLELDPVESAHVHILDPEVEGVWMESERLFPDDVS